MSRRPIVYAPQQPSKYDAATQLWLPNVNLTPARKFGDLQVMLPPQLNSMMVGPLIEVMKEKMRDFTSRDYVLAVGDPSLIAAAAGIASLKTAGHFNMLKWDRSVKDYIEVELKL